MRKVLALLLLTLSSTAVNAVAAETAGITPEALVQRGISSYRAGHFSDAATDLNNAAQALLSQEQMQNYVNTGKFPNLERLESALVYLTLAQSKLGRTDDAREAVLRLMTAERIEPVYAQLPLTSDASEFESIAAKLVPGSSLPKNVQLARGGAPATTTATGTVAEAAPTGPTSVTTAPATPPEAAPAQPVVAASVLPAPKPAPTVATTTTSETRQSTTTTSPTTTTTAEKLAVEPTLAAERAERQRIIDEIVAQERARIQKEADQRVAAIQKAADERIAAAQRAADERVAQAQKAAEAQIVAMQAQMRRNYLLSLRQADAYASNGKIEQANQIYAAVVNSQDAPREMVAEAGVGLYRTGSFSNAVIAFQKLAPYARGEEDLRYYNAVSLYETGNYDEAKKELACALPYIQLTSDVRRYQTKIEQSSSRQASR